MELPLFFSILFIVILLYWSAWISSAETALFSISSHKIKAYHDDQDPRKKLIAALLAKPRDLLVTVFMINTFVNIMLQNVASDMFGEGAGLGLKVGIPLILTLVFGEIIPKYIGLQNNLSISYRIAPTVFRLEQLLSWVRRWIISITTPLSRLMFFFLKKESSISKQEIEHALKTSQQHGVLKQDEGELLSGYLNLQEAQTKELMWPKEDILFYDLNQPVTKLISLFVDESTTRIPVCDLTIENVKGILTAMDYFKFQEHFKVGLDLIPYLQKPYFAPETMPAKNLLKRMDAQKQVLAIIVDEYGSVSGLIAREDLIEVVVGQIEDPNDPALYIKAGNNEVISSGKWELSEFNEFFKVNFESPENMITIGGWLIEEIGDIPKGGSKYELNGFTFHILSSNPSRILRLFIRKNAARSK